MGCVFCGIISGERPSYSVYEDALCKGFLPLKPIAKGHVILAAKEHIEAYVDLPEETTAHMALVAKQIGQKIKERFSPRKIGFAVAGFEIEHAHMHIVPLNTQHEITSSVYATVKENTVIWSDKSMMAMTEAEQIDIQKRLL